MRLLALLTFLKTSRALLVLSPPGPCDVAVKNFELVDLNRIDTFAPKPNTKRSIMVSAYLPIDAKYGCKDEVVPYVPALTAKAYGKVAGTLGLPDNIVMDFEMKVRTQDESFVIPQLCNHTLVEQVFGDFPGTLDPHRVAVYGHSFGGSTAAVTAQRDRRVNGGLNFDGPMYGSVVEEGLKSTPYILVGTKMTSDPVPGWNAFYDKIDAAKMEMVVKHTRHYAFTDVPLLLTEFKIPAKSEAMVHEVFGMLSGRKVEKAANEIMVRFLDLVFKTNARKLNAIGNKGGIRVLRRDLA
ncbi:Platelet-activating factor acetylhydrolase [Fusarium agapanthi]|uniref:1-alkyl-2-acetylglycerophosphocholine esterase n=1 Tax=Fusarium agapanthi TaxID=1803897 RepID=A0A9P5EAI7_9HYPO|nr:Platelet-activating factor acetylhydrolase [Fusarium agapanthi]